MSAAATRAGARRRRHRRPIYVESRIRASLDRLWNATQQPDLHQRWDARFGTISYLPTPPIEGVLTESRLARRRVERAAGFLAGLLAGFFTAGLTGFSSPTKDQLSPRSFDRNTPVLVPA